MKRRSLLKGLSASFLAAPAIIHARGLSMLLGSPPSDSGGGPAPYVAKAVHFDGDTYLSIASFIAAASTNVFSFSIWLEPVEQTNPQAIFVTDPNGGYTNALDIFNRPSGTASAGQFELTNADFSQFFSISDIESPPSNPLGGGWHNLMGEGDTDSGVGAFYLDDVPLPMNNTFDTSFNMVFNGLQQVIGGDTFAPNYIGNLADCWIAPGVAADFSVQANRRKFISALGKPVDPSGWPTAAMIFSGDADTFTNNQGTGGAFTLTGTLTNAPTSPSD